MITWNELVHGTPINDIDIETQHNLEELLGKLNQIREKFSKPMRITSGLRTMYKHKQIYAEINARRVKRGLSEVRVPTKSLHLYGKAADVADVNGELQKWCTENIALLEEIGLWCEHFDHTNGWVHFQISPPKSGKRFFLP